MIPGLELPPSVARCVGPEAPEELRIDVARGAIPLAPSDRLASLAVLLSDPSAFVRAEAHRAWRELPETFLEEALADPALPGPLLDFVAVLEGRRASFVLRALEHPCLARRTVERFLGSEDPEVLARIACNQRLLQEHPDLARALLKNPAVPPGERSRLASLLGEDDGGPELPPVDDVALPEDLPRELLEDAESEPAGGEAQSQNLYQLVQCLSVAEKVKLATLGSKGARKLLIRDTNKLVAVAVIRSPKLREDEVLTIAQDRTVHDEVVRIILTRKDWLKTYPIRLALCQNPKTPIPKALRMLETLNEKDLRQLSKSRNVAGAVSTGALRLLSRRGKT